MIKNQDCMHFKRLKL